MIDKIKPLLEIQNIDIRISTIENEFKEIPDEISSINYKIKSEETKIENLTEKISALESLSKNFQIDISDIEEKVKQIEEKLFSIKSAKEFEALQKETGDLKRKKLEIEDNQLKTMEEIESFNKDFETTKSNFELEVLPTKDKINELEAALNESKDEIEDLNKQRTELSKEADTEFLKIYNRLSTNNNPPIISETTGEVCGHCNMKIPPQIYIKVLQGKEIVLAPCCKKILIPKID